jgi:hypothetical protein
MHPQEEKMPTATPDNPYAVPQFVPEVSAPSDDHLEDKRFNPWVTVWVRPRSTVRTLVARNPELHVYLLAGLTGIGHTLDRASLRDAGDTLSFPAILAIACLFGPLGGLLTLWIGSHLLRISGQVIGGRGRAKALRTAIAWASVPRVFTLLLWIPLLGLFGSEMFTEEIPRLDAQPLLWLPFLGISLLSVVLGIWSFVLLCNTVAEVQGFHSAWSGLGNLILAALLFAVPLIAVVVGVALLISRGT